LPLQVLQIIVMDEDLVSSQDKVIGVAQIPLKTVSTQARHLTLFLGMNSRSYVLLVIATISGQGHWRGADPFQDSCVPILQTQIIVLAGTCRFVLHITGFQTRPAKWRRSIFFRQCHHSHPLPGFSRWLLCN
jgi:hypothetical protein